jgi:hypothetical protein
MKPISLTLHGAIDYLAVLIFLQPRPLSGCQVGLPCCPMRSQAFIYS